MPPPRRSRSRSSRASAATTFIRIGTCGSLQAHARVGDIAIFDSAIRADGASALYAPLEYPAVAHHEVVDAAIAAARGLEVPHHVGTTFSTDLFYVPEPGSAFGGYEQSAWRERYADIARTNAIAAEMETSVLLVLARIWGLRAGALALVSDAVDDTSESGEFVPEATFDVSAEPIDRLARVGCETAQDPGRARPRPIVHRPDGSPVGGRGNAGGGGG